MATTQQTDVLSAGGGPRGLMPAKELGRRHIRCLLVDPKPGTAFNPRDCAARLAPLAQGVGRSAP